MSQTPIRGSFKTTLHNSQILIPSVLNDYRSVSTTSQTTLLMDSVSAFLWEAPSVLMNLAKDKLPTINQSLGDYMAQVEKSHYLHTEADVERASDVYLINPVNIAIQELLPNGGRVICRGEQTDRKKNRTDLRWTYFKGSQSAGIAVLEMKAPFVLRWNDFGEAVATASNAKQMHDKAHRFPEHTLLKDNAIILSKQTRKYSKNLNIADVAIFDWNSIFVFDYSDVDEDSSNPKPARGSWFRETDGDPGQGQTFRMMLLWLLIRGLQRNGIVS
jgi:hypothetical protein